MVGAVVSLPSHSLKHRELHNRSTFPSYNDSPKESFEAIAAESGPVKRVLHLAGDMTLKSNVDGDQIHYRASILIEISGSIVKDLCHRLGFIAHLTRAALSS